MFGVSSKLMELGSSDLGLIEKSLIVFTHALGGSGFPENDDSVLEETFNQNFGKRLPIWFNFLMLQTLSSIIALNTLIAIIGDSYDSV